MGAPINHQDTNEDPSTVQPPMPHAPLPPIARIGVTVLHEPPSDVPIVADVVFVHGLMGHPAETWLYGDLPDQETPQTAADDNQAKAKRFWKMNWKPRKETQDPKQPVPDKESKYCYWPLQLLPQEFNNLRVMTYGYDSDPSHFFASKTTQMNITQQKEDLLNRVTGVRSKCRNRPLIFVAHSLGGVLVKGAITESLRMKHQQALQDLGQSCKAIFFFGTPHLGADIAAFGKIVCDIVGALPGGFSTNKDILRGLTPGSEVLYTINRDFSDLIDEPMIPSRKIQICSFQEGQGLSSVKGLGSKVVPDSSSKFNRRDIERSFFVQEANHMNMCKFRSTAATAFQDFVPVLTDYLKLIKDHQEGDRIEHWNPSSAPLNPYVASHSADSALPSGQAPSLPLTDNPALLKALYYAERTMKEQQLNSLYCEEDSFAWVWSSELGNWLKTMDPFFWIAGKPASGKSTLINYMLKAVHLKEELSVASAPHWSICHHFFDFRAGKGIANNFNGVLRALLYQLFSELPDVANKTIKEFPKLGRAESDWVDDSGVLRGAFGFALSVAQGPILLMLDGLDEYEGNMIELTQWVLKLKHPNTKICISSRPDPDLFAAFRAFPSLRMEITNSPGIRSFLQETLKGQTSLARHGTQFIEKMTNDIASRSQGVFLWARFAVYEVIRGDSRREDPQTIQRRLEALPEELDDLYSRIFSRIDPPAKRNAGILLCLITTGLRPLRLSELFEASILADITRWNTVKLVDEQDLRDFEVKLIDIGVGVLETVPVDGSESSGALVLQEIRLIHRTVETYLDKRGWIELLHEDADNLHRLTWLRVCTQFLRYPSERVAWASLLAPIKSDYDVSPPATGPGPVAQFSLGPYIFANLPDIFSLVDSNKDPTSWAEISSLFTEELVREHIRLSKTREQVEDCLCGDAAVLAKNVTTGIQLAVIHHGSRYVEEYLSGGDFASAAASIPLTQNPSGITQEGSSRRTETSIVDAQELYRLVAICASLPSMYAAPGEQYPSLIRLLSPLVTKPVEDTVMLRLLRRGSVADIQSYLDNFPSGKLVLKSAFFCVCFNAPQTCECEQSESIQEYSPLWVIMRRDGRHAQINRLFELFIRRGEDVDTSGGPDPTLFHTAVVHQHRQVLNYPYLEYNIDDKIDILAQYSAKFRMTEFEENALEHAWKVFHRFRMAQAEALDAIILRHTHAIILRHTLIKLQDIGMENERKDPNGLVPTPERMINFGKFYTEYGPDGKRLTELTDMYPGKERWLNLGRIIDGSEGDPQEDCSVQSLCMERAYYYTGDPGRWKDFFDPSEWFDDDELEDMKTLKAPE